MSALAPFTRRAHARRQDIAVGLAKPQTTVAMAGEPHPMGYGGGNVSLDPETRQICLYAAAICRQRGLLPPDASAIDALLTDDDTVIFIRADASQAEVCRLTVTIIAPDAAETE